MYGNRFDIYCFITAKNIACHTILLRISCTAATEATVQTTAAEKQLFTSGTVIGKTNSKSPVSLLETECGGMTAHPQIKRNSIPAILIKAITAAHTHIQAARCTAGSIFTALTARNSISAALSSFAPVSLSECVCLAVIPSAASESPQRR